MKTTGKLKLFFGIIVVLLIVGLLTLYLNYAMGISQSQKATLDAQARSIGTDYSGLVVKQNVEEGQEVKKDQVLFEIDSQDLRQRLANDTLQPDGLALNSQNGNLELRANNDGVIDEIFFREGAYISSGAVIAKVYVIDSLFVKAHFQLSPPDYARIQEDKTVELLFPDNTRKEAKITTVTLESSEDKEKVDTVVTAKIIDADMSDFRFSVGTPVSATLYLEQNAWYQAIIDFVQGLFTPKEQ